jgi:hypothetical protein
MLDTFTSVFRPIFTRLRVPLAMRSKAFVLPIPNMVHAVWTSASRGRTVLAFFASETFIDILDFLGLRDFSDTRDLFDFAFFIRFVFHDTAAGRS